MGLGIQGAKLKRSVTASMHRSTLHIVQGGWGNDKQELERAAARGTTVDSWVAPKAATVDDDVVINLGGQGLFATARIAAPPQRRRDLRNRYGADLKAVRLIKPPISLSVLRRRLPALKWTMYPRSITTPALNAANRLRQLIRDRRSLRGAEISPKELRDASLEELRALASGRSGRKATARQRRVTTRVRRAAVKWYVLKRAGGRCEYCRNTAPFRMANGAPYLESHHVIRLADEGADNFRNAIAVCPNCHRRAHLAHDWKKIMTQMKRRVAVLERKRARS